MKIFYLSIIIVAILAFFSCNNQDEETLSESAPPPLETKDTVNKENTISNTAISDIAKEEPKITTE